MITSVNEDANTCHLVGPGYTWMKNACPLLGAQQGSTVSAMIHDGNNTVWEENGPEGSWMQGVGDSLSRIKLVRSGSIFLNLKLNCFQMMVLPSSSLSLAHWCTAPQLVLGVTRA